MCCNDFNVLSFKVAECAEQCTEHVNTAVRKLKRLFFVEDIVDSIKVCIILLQIILRKDINEINRRFSVILMPFLRY